MKRTFVASLLVLAFASILFSACGGGGGGGVTPIPQPTTAVLTLSTAVTGTIPPNIVIEGYDVTVTLPAGVTVKTMLSSAQTGTGVVTASGQASGATIIGVYTAATATLPGTVSVTVGASSAINPGEFCKVNADIAAGTYPTPSSFAQPTLDSAQGWDNNIDGNVNVTPQLTLSQTAVIN